MPKAIKPGETVRLTWQLENTNKVEWSVSDPRILTITADGIITAHRPGTARITAKMDNGTSTFSVRVNPVRVKSITIMDKPETLRPDDQIALQALVLPADVYESGVKWTSSNKRVAAIDQSGVLTIIAPGKVTITATSKDNPDIKDKASIVIGVFSESIVIAAPDEAQGGDKIELSAIVLPEDTTNPSVKWEVVPKGAGTISSKGILSLKKVKQPTEIIVRATTKDTGIMTEHTILIVP